MKLEPAQVVKHAEFSGEYMELVLSCPSISSIATPGQFLHLRILNLENSVLRRPFSIFGAGDDQVSILYKIVGKGTQAMTAMKPGEHLSLLGPLGNGFPAKQRGTFPVLVAGGYGVAPLCFLAGRMDEKGIVFIGGAHSGDILCTEHFESLGWEVRITTEDESLGEKGLVTSALDEWLESKPGSLVPEFYACGPDGMLKAVAQRAGDGQNAWLSLDKHMGCGVGACLACVQKINTGDGIKWKRVCKDGPIFEAKEIVWE